MLSTKKILALSKDKDNEIKNQKSKDKNQIGIWNLFLGI